MIVINIANQTLAFGNWQVSCSTARLGVGEADGSGRTPRGLHRVAEKFGAGAVPLQAFKGRRPHAVWTPASDPTKDWILSRILWLEGLETGYNQGLGRDSKARYIYIHGTPPTEPMGIPQSHGCIRLRPGDVMALFDRVQVGELVLIKEQF